MKPGALATFPVGPLVVQEPTSLATGTRIRPRSSVNCEKCVSPSEIKCAEMSCVARDPYHLITTGGEGHFYKRDEDIGYWLDGQWVSDYNYNGQGWHENLIHLTFELDLILCQLVKTSIWILHWTILISGPT